MPQIMPKIVHPKAFRHRPEVTFDSQAARLILWCRNQALPLWASKGIDPSGGFWERLNLDGSPKTDCLKRVRVQARQTYVYAHAAHLGWYPDAHIAADHGWEYLTTKGFAGAQDHPHIDGFAGIAHLLNPDGSLHDGMRDTYAQAFLMLAAAWRYQAFGDLKAKQILEQTTDFLNKELKSGFGGWHECLPQTHAAWSPRRQNPHMHLFEAFLAAYNITKEPQYLSYLDEIIELFEKHFFDRRTSTLLEFFDQRWMPDKKAGDLIEPGHMMEWAWLIYTYTRITGKDISHYAEELFAKGVKLGLNQETGLLHNELRVNGHIVKSSSRLWPITEYIKVSMARARYGHDGAEQDAANMIDQLFTYYLDMPLKGGWHDEIDAQGNIVSHDITASTFYHIFCAATEVDRRKYKRPDDDEGLKPPPHIGVERRLEKR